MSTEDKNTNFESEDEAMEFLIQQSKDRKLKNHFQKLFSASDEPIKTESKVIPLRSRILGITSVAAIILIGIALGFIFLNKQDNIQIVAANLVEQTSFEAPEISRGNETVSQNLDRKINDALSIKNYTSAIELLTQKEGKMTQADSFFLAVSLFKTHDNNYSRIQALVAPSIGSKSEFLSEALWISALTYIQKGENIKAMEMLESLQPLQYQSENVGRLLDILEKD
ncbi:MAG: hypothetical protein P1U56_13890 [Saprospiraceae bacterium]|nr:hypothetical protein [Saprospiraceae bacterium]